MYFEMVNIANLFALVLFDVHEILTESGFTDCYVYCFVILINAMTLKKSGKPEILTIF